MFQWIDPSFPYQAKELTKELAATKKDLLSQIKMISSNLTAADIRFEI